MDTGSVAGPTTFLSYARADAEFADEVLQGLTWAGFQVAIDRNSIAEGEDWKRRLAALIAQADAVVVVLSPNSIASPVCRWEIDEARRLSKRLLPVVARPFEGHAPDAVATLNYVRFDPLPDGRARSFIAGLRALDIALRADLDWIREHTRLLLRALEWDHGGRPWERLLHGGDIQMAMRWLGEKPPGAPEPTALHASFIQASEEAEVERRQYAREQQELMEERKAFALEVLNAMRSLMHRELVLRSIEAQVDLQRHDPMASKFLRNSADQWTARNIKSTLDAVLYGEGRWHPQAATRIRSLGALDDYVDVYAFPCCGISTFEIPHQLRADGCVSPQPSGGPSGRRSGYWAPDGNRCVTDPGPSALPCRRRG